MGKIGNKKNTRIKDNIIRETKITTWRRCGRKVINEKKYGEEIL